MAPRIAVCIAPSLTMTWSWSPLRRRDGTTPRIAVSDCCLLAVCNRRANWLDSTWSDHVEAVTVADANRAAQDYCNVSRAEVAVVGDRSVVAPTLEGLGMPIIDYDAQGNRKR